MRKRSDFRIVAVLFLVTLTIFIINQSRTRTEETKAEILLPVTIEKPQMGDLQKIYSLNGYLETSDVVTVLPKVSGNLQVLDWEVGDYIYKDQIVGIIDSEQLELSTSQAATAYRTSKDTFERQELLYKSKATSKQNYEQSKSAYEANKAQYELASLQLSYSQIRAPISGTILQIHTSEGSLVSPGIPIVTIGSLDDLIITLNVPEKYYEYFYIKDNEMKITLNRPDYTLKEYPVKIRYISPVINPRTMSFEVVCDFIEAPEILRPGMFMKAKFVLDGKSNIYYIPVESVKDNHVWYVDKESSRAHKLAIPEGFSNDDFTEIPEEYKDYAIINEGFYFLTENQKVNILKVSSE